MAPGIIVCERFSRVWVDALARAVHVHDIAVRRASLRIHYADGIDAVVQAMSSRPTFLQRQQGSGFSACLAWRPLSCGWPAGKHESARPLVGLFKDLRNNLLLVEIVRERVSVRAWPTAKYAKTERRASRGGSTPLDAWATMYGVA